LQALLQRIILGIIGEEKRTARKVKSLVLAYSRKLTRFRNVHAYVARDYNYLMPEYYCLFLYFL